MSEMDPAKAIKPLLDLQRDFIADIIDERERHLAEIARLRTLLEAAERHWQAHLRGEAV